MKTMEWQALLDTRRLGGRKPKTEAGRSPFNSDHDKVIFSGAFRRLARKTQVHPLATNDHVHNRLTHSLEVASVGRSLGIRIGQALKLRGDLPNDMEASDIGDIVQTACLAHDIGNPPFGHTGEDAIRQWFTQESSRPFMKRLDEKERRDLEHFEGNAQGLRLLTTSEYHPHDGGMRLSYASLAAFIKYPWTAGPAIAGNRPKRNKYGIFQSELHLFHEIAEATGLIRRGKDWYCRHPLVHLMEIADDFCYGLIDLEDGIEMGILEWEEVYAILEPILDQKKKAALAADLKAVRARYRPPLIRGKVISAFVEDATNAFIENRSLILEGGCDELLPLCGATVRTCVEKAKNLAKDKVFSHPRKIELEIGAYSTIATILDVLCHAAIAPPGKKRPMDFRSKRAIDLMGADTFNLRKITSRNHDNSIEYLSLMRVLDYVSGMTDNYALHLAKQFTGFGGIR